MRLSTRSAALTISTLTIVPVSYAAPVDAAPALVKRLINVGQPQPVNPIPGLPIISPVSPPANYVGCFVDSVSNRVLPLASSADDSMTVAKCASNCAGFAYYGLEFGRECFCGNTKPTVSAPDSECAKPCAGDPSTKCGDSNRISVYMDPAYVAAVPETLPSTQYKGCYTDSQAVRTLSERVFFDDNMTPELCASKCASYPYFGVEYGKECYCGSAIGGQKAAESDCSERCAGNSAYLCGAADRINVYGPEVISGYEYTGCYSDAYNDRTLKGKFDFEMTITLEKCAEVCSEYNYFGVEFGTQCFCGTAIASTATTKSGTQCQMPCMGSWGEKCGGVDSVAIYQSTPAKPTPTNVVSSGQFSYQGCYSDNVMLRTLPTQKTNVGAVTVESCAAACSGYTYFGTEYGGECFCGNLRGGSRLNETSCGYICDADATEICGGAGAISVYQLPQVVTEE